MSPSPKTTNAQILDLLLHRGPMSPLELRALIGLGRGAVGYRLRRLVAEGLAVAIPHTPYHVVYYHAEDPFGIPPWTERDTLELITYRCSGCGEIRAHPPQPHLPPPPHLLCSDCKPPRPRRPRKLPRPAHDEPEEVLL